MDAGAGREESDLVKELIGVIEGQIKVRGVRRPDALQQLARLLGSEGIDLYECALSDRDSFMQVVAMLSLTRYDDDGRARLASERWARRKLRNRLNRVTAHPIEIFLILSYFDVIDELRTAAGLLQTFDDQLTALERGALDLVWTPEARREWVLANRSERPHLLVFGHDRIPTELFLDLIDAEITGQEPAWQMPSPGQPIDPMQQQAIDAFAALSSRSNQPKDT